MHARHHAAHRPRAEARDEERKAEGETGGERDVQVVDPALGHAADHREHDQTEHVVDHGRRQDDAARAHVQQSARGQHLGRDSDAGGDHGRAGEDALQPRLAPKRADSPSGEEGHDDSGDCHQQRRAADLHQFRGLHFQPDAEEQKHHTEVGERMQEFAGREPAKHVRADQDARENFSDDARLSEALEEFRQKFGRREDQEHRERDLGGRRHESIMACASVTGAESDLMQHARIGAANKRSGGGLVGARLVLQRDRHGVGILRRRRAACASRCRRAPIGTCPPPSPCRP